MGNSTRQRIIEKLGRAPANVERYERVYNIYKETPDKKPSDAQIESKIPAPTFYRIYKEMKEAQLLGDVYRIREYFIPSQFLSGQLPPAHWDGVHLAAYLADLPNNVPTQYGGMTKQEVIQQLQLRATNLPIEISEDVFFGMFERLAYLAIISNNLEPFSKMVGTIKPPEHLPWSYNDE